MDKMKVLINKIKEFFNFKNKGFERAFILLIIFSLSFLIMSLTFVFSSAAWDINMFKSYYSSFNLILMNFIPIFLFMIILYLVLNKLWLSFFISSFLFVVMSIVNRFKLLYRDEPFWFIDIKLLRESMDMKQKYEITFTKNMIIMFLGLIFISAVLNLIFDYKEESKKIRYSSLFTLGIISYFIFSGPYFNSKVYAELGDKSLINIWSQSQQYQSKGFVYPFIYSITEVIDNPLEGYDEEIALDTLNQYEYKDIPEEKRINLISIMLEAYSDFSTFEQLQFNKDPYEYFHKLQNESISGNLVTNVFGGGTINTERAFLTGYHHHPKYHKNTNSFVWYLKDQGYYTEAMHPIYGWFYNRRNVNTYLGFDNYDYYENKYSQINEEYLHDMEFFDYIIQGYEKSRDKYVPYYNFSVTYQNHGPYDENYYEENQFISGGSKEDVVFNMINNYFSGISRTDEALEKLIGYFENEEEPVVVVLFGDHKPWLGQDDKGYELMGIDISFDSAEGFLNYYQTPYIIWGNDAAKKVIGNDLVGVKEDISPNFLMAEVFKALDWEGNEYMQYIKDTMNHYDVNHDVYNKENGEYVRILSRENQDRYFEYRNLEHYINRNFKRMDR